MTKLVDLTMMSRELVSIQCDQLSFDTVCYVDTMTIPIQVSRYLPKYLSILPEASYLKIRRSLFIFLLHQHPINDNMPVTGSDTALGASKGLLGPSNTALLHDVSGMCLA
jgi:hypothetical protein